MSLQTIKLINHDPVITQLHVTSLNSGGKRTAWTLKTQHACMQIIYTVEKPATKARVMHCNMEMLLLVSEPQCWFQSHNVDASCPDQNHSTKTSHCSSFPKYYALYLNLVLAVVNLVLVAPLHSTFSLVVTTIQLGQAEIVRRYNKRRCRYIKRILSQNKPSSTFLSLLRACRYIKRRYSEILL